MVRVSEEVASQRGVSADRIPLAGSVYDEVLRTQKPVRAPDGQDGHRILTPVTDRGDTLGILELFLPEAADDVLEQVEEAAHALAHIVVTDLYQWGQRTSPVGPGAEIQRRLLPSVPSTEAAEFALACALAPVDSVAGDAYDYTLDHDTLYLSITDAMGHDVDATLICLDWHGPTTAERHTRAGVDIQGVSVTPPSAERATMLPVPTRRPSTPPRCSCGPADGPVVTAGDRLRSPRVTSGAWWGPSDGCRT
ncbi:hypothetical protein ACFQ9J_03360 [Streptomyces sp. NPDC056529]|uniref:hypothetical protein n=1 Tax=Streptomyces sp. NPDC056529 TaxID=3345855 RepID=UPI0036940FF8